MHRFATIGGKGRREERGDGPTAQEALRRLEPLVGEWTLEAQASGRAAVTWRGKGDDRMAPLGAHLVQRASVDVPGAPDNVSIMGCDAANGTYFRLYSDERGVCCVYEMSIGGGRWEPWREGEPFPQHFTATIGDDGDTIPGRWEKAPTRRIRRGRQQIRPT